VPYSYEKPNFMATTILLRNQKTGMVKKGFYGFSWTTFFFGGLPAIFRGDIAIGLILVILQVLTLGVATLIWAFVYNKHYTTKLLEKDYVFADSEGAVALARMKLGITAPDKSIPQNQHAA
jgi:hypothetical protein